MTGSELLAFARAQKPHIDYVLNGRGTAIGAWGEEKGRYVVVAAQGLDGRFVTMPNEVLVNGCPFPEDWPARNDRLTKETPK